jgi:hypothetical protein
MSRSASSPGRADREPGLHGDQQAGRDDVTTGPGRAPARKAYGASGRRREARTGVLIGIAWLALGATAWAAAASVVIEDWSAHAPGARGIPPGWKGQSWGRPAYDFTIAEDGGRRVLHLRSHNEGSTIARSIRGQVLLAATPVLQWQWKAVVLPTGGDSRRGATDDQAAQIFVGWPRSPEPVRSRLIGYVWDTMAPVGTIVKSEKTGTVTYVVVRSGPTALGQWLTERRNVADDYRRIFGEEPENPGTVAISIDSNDTRSVAESFLGPIRFTAP